MSTKTIIKADSERRSEAWKLRTRAEGINGKPDLHVADLRHRVTPDGVGFHDNEPSRISWTGFESNRKVGKGREGLVNTLGVGGSPGRRRHNDGNQRRSNDDGQRQQNRKPKQSVEFHRN